MSNCLYIAVCIYIFQWSAVFFFTCTLKHFQMCTNKNTVGDHHWEKPHWARGCCVKYSLWRMLPSCLLFEAVNNNNSTIHFVWVMSYLTEENKLHLLSTTYWWQYCHLDNLKFMQSKIHAKRHFVTQSCKVSESYKEIDKVCIHNFDGWIILKCGHLQEQRGNGRWTELAQDYFQ